MEWKKIKLKLFKSMGEYDQHGVVNEILELEYYGEPLKRVVLFNYEWYDPTYPGVTRKYNHYKIIEINHTKGYRKFDTFIIAQNTRQVYYLHCNTLIVPTYT